MTAEGDIVRGILQYLHLRRIEAWRNNTGCLRDRTGRPVTFGRVGSGDIFAILDGGRFMSIECKQEGKCPTKKQKAFAEIINRAGGLAIVARSIDDVEDALAEVN